VFEENLLIASHQDDSLDYGLNSNRCSLASLINVGSSAVLSSIQTPTPLNADEENEYETDIYSRNIIKAHKK